MGHETQDTISRRSLLRGTTVAGTAMLLASGPLRALAATPAQIEGPFHPVNLDTDLTRKDATSPVASGDVHYVTGQVTDDKTGKPLQGVVIELWQADENGFYDHPADPRQGDRDRNFQFWGRATTDANGRYQFKTIKPGSYPAAEGWDRPPHIHFRFLRRGYHELTTQMYFAEERQLNGVDRLLQALPAEEQKKLVVEFKASAKIEANAKIGRFDIQLRPV